MALIRRFSRLLTADMHAMLDRLEEPRTVLRQAIRDMEAELARLEQRIRHGEADIDDGDRRLGLLERSIAETNGKLDLCLAEDDDALARRLVRRKLETQRLSRELRDARESRARELASLTSLASAQREDLDTLRQKAALFLAPDAAVTAQATDDAIDETDVEIALLAEKQARNLA